MLIKRLKFVRRCKRATALLDVLIILGTFLLVPIYIGILVWAIEGWAALSNGEKWFMLLYTCQMVVYVIVAVFCGRDLNNR